MIHINSIRPTLCVDLESGYGDVGNTQHFMKLSPVTRLDILQDWIDELQFLYDETYVEMKNDYSKKFGHLKSSSIDFQP